MVYLIILLMTFLGSVASVFFKKASSNSSSFVGLIKTPSLYWGGCLYITAALLNLYVLHYIEYSKVLPFTSITYIWTLLLSYYLFHEKIGIAKFVGVFLIFVGVVLIAI